MMTAEKEVKKVYSDLQMEVLSEYKLVSIDLLKFNKQYQRSIEFSRKKNIRNSIENYGYWPEEIIIVNDKYEIIDGQHRVEAAKECGIKELPISMRRFKTKILEAKYFKDKNSFDTKLKPTDYFNAAYEAKDDYAILLYELAKNDNKSLLQYRCILKDLKNKDTIFSISNACDIINFTGLKTQQVWRKQRHFIFNRLIKKMHKEGKEQDVNFFIRDDVNKFLKWFFACFGKDKTKNKNAYRQRSIRAILQFYFSLKSQEFINEDARIYNYCVSKMSHFEFDDVFLKADEIGKVMYLVNYYNKGKKYKLEYKI